MHFSRWLLQFLGKGWEFLLDYCGALLVCLFYITYASIIYLQCLLAQDAQKTCMRLKKKESKSKTENIEKLSKLTWNLNKKLKKRKFKTVLLTKKMIDLKACLKIWKDWWSIEQKLYNSLNQYGIKNVQNATS